MEKRVILVLLTANLWILSSCTLRLDYHLVNRTDTAIEFKIYNYFLKEIGTYQFKSSCNTLSRLRVDSYEKFGCVTEAKSNDGVFLTGRLPANATIYIGFSHGPIGYEPCRIFQQITLSDYNSRIDTITYQNLNFKGRLAFYIFN